MGRNGGSGPRSPPPPPCEEDGRGAEAQGHCTHPKSHDAAVHSRGLARKRKKTWMENNTHSGLCTILRAYLSAVTLFGCKGLPSAFTPDGSRCRPCDLFPSVYRRRLRSVYRGMTGERTRICFEGWLDGEGGGVRNRHRARASPALDWVGRLASRLACVNLGVLVWR